MRFALPDRPCLGCFRLFTPRYFFDHLCSFGCEIYQWPDDEPVLPEKALLISNRAEYQRQREALCQRFLPMVFGQAFKHKHFWMQSRLGSLGDIFQEAVVGLLLAIDGYDPTYRTAEGEPVKFQTYAMNCVYRWIQAAANRCSHVTVPVHVQVALASGKGGEDDKDWQERVRAARLALDCKPWPTNDAKREYQHDRGSPLDLVSAKRDGGIWEDVDLMREALCILKPREREIVVRRWGLEESGPEPLVDIGADLGISKERVRQIEEKALEKLTKWLYRSRRRGGWERESPVFERQAARLPELRASDPAGAVEVLADVCEVW